MNLKPLIFIFVFIVLSSLVCGAKTTSIQQSVGGLAIEYVKVVTLKQNEPFEFNYHVFNITDGTALNQNNSYLNCTFHLYNSTGDHIVILTNNITTYNYDYEFLVTGSNFSKLGLYSVVIQCSIPTMQSYKDLIGGYTSYELEVTYNGQVISNDVYEGHFPALILLIITLIFAWFAISFKESNAWRIFFLLSTMLMFVVDLRFSNVMLDSVTTTGLDDTIKTNMLGNLTTLYSISISIFVLLLAITGFYLIVISVRHFINKKKSVMEGGILPK